MNRRAFCGAVLIIVAAAFVTSTSAESALQTKRAVFLSVKWQGKERPSNVAALEGDGATVTIPNVGQFKFSPTVKDDGKTVVVSISDVSSQPGKELGMVTLVAGGKSASSKTKPAFEIQVQSVK